MSFILCHIRQLKWSQMNNIILSSNLMRRWCSGIPRVKIKRLGEKGLGDVVRVQGWVRTNRKQKTLSFLQLNDGSTLAGIQAVWNSSDSQQQRETSSEDDDGDIVDINVIGTGAAVDVTGTLHESPGKKQGLEIYVKSIKLIGDCDVSKYPLQKKRHSLEYLRSISHLRARTNTFGAVSRVRSALAYAAHSFFQEEGFLYLQTPIITSSDCEGAGDMFRVTTLPVGNDLKAIDTDVDNKSSRTNNEKNIITNGMDSSSTAARCEDFFDKPTFLTVSGQLTAETYACAVGDVYTFGPTFRAENSNTSRHLAEFHMIEPELAFSDLTAVMNNAELFMKHVISYTLKHCAEDLEFFTNFYDKTLVDRLHFLVKQPFMRISYKEAITMLQNEINKDPSQWTYPNVTFGSDLANEHEKWLCENTPNGKACVFVYDYPKTIKAFYMRDNDDNETVAAFDLLVPGVGELIGGAQREERLGRLIEKISEKHMDIESYQWYLDTRRYGSVPHGGYGVGFERLVCLVTAMDNIRDAVAFPRVPGNSFP